MTLSAELSAKVARLAKLQASIEADSGTLDPVTFARRRFRAFDREKGTVTRVIDGIALELPPSTLNPAPVQLERFTRIA